MDFLYFSSFYATPNKLYKVVFTDIKQMNIILPSSGTWLLGGDENRLGACLFDFSKFKSALSSIGRKITELEDVYLIYSEDGVEFYKTPCLYEFCIGKDIASELILQYYGDEVTPSDLSDQSTLIKYTEKVLSCQCGLQLDNEILDLDDVLSISIASDTNKSEEFAVKVGVPYTFESTPDGFTPFKLNGSYWKNYTDACDFFNNIEIELLEE